MYEEGHDPLDISQSYRGLKVGCTLAFATLCRREQQGRVEDIAVMSGCSFGCCLIASALSFGVFKLYGALHGGQQGRFLTKLEVIPGKLPFLIVWQLSGINKDVVIPFTGLNDLPPHLVFRFL